MHFNFIVVLKNVCFRIRTETSSSAPAMCSRRIQCRCFFLSFSIYKTVSTVESKFIEWLLNSSTWCSDWPSARHQSASFLWLSIAEIHSSTLVLLFFLSYRTSKIYMGKHPKSLNRRDCNAVDSDWQRFKRASLLNWNNSVANGLVMSSNVGIDAKKQKNTNSQNMY